MREHPSADLWRKHVAVEVHAVVIYLELFLQRGGEEGVGLAKARRTHLCIHQHALAYVSMRQHTSVCLHTTICVVSSYYYTNI